jgi:outer membrane protein OmpA-like peptidoglycan-associated protein
MRRAESVKSVLVRPGVRKARIQVASLGERRPLDFASSDTARQLNRRVEVLLDNAEFKPVSPLQRAMPKC